MRESVDSSFRFIVSSSYHAIDYLPNVCTIQYDTARFMCETPFCLARCFSFFFALRRLSLPCGGENAFFLSSFAQAASDPVWDTYVCIYIIYNPILASSASVLSCEWEHGRSKQAREGAAKGSKKKTVKEKGGAVKKQRKAARKQRRALKKQKKAMRKR